MSKRLVHLCLILGLVLSSAHAEVVVLRSGQQVKGEVLLNNEEVVIVRKKDGSKYQFPQSEVVRIEQETVVKATPSNTNIVREKKLAVRIAATGGSAYIPHYGWGGATDAHLMLGSHNLLKQNIFLGGSVGYRGVFEADNTYSWIPLQLVLQSPVAGQAHSPHQLLLGTSFGYAIATSQEWKSGICAGIDIGWWYSINERSSMSVSCTAQWQQTRINITETINQIEYHNLVGCNIIELGLKIGVQF